MKKVVNTAQIIQPMSNMTMLGFDESIIYPHDINILTNQLVIYFKTQKSPSKLTGSNLF